MFASWSLAATINRVSFFFLLISILNALGCCRAPASVATRQAERLPYKTKSASPNFQLPPQDPVQETEQAHGRPNQDQRVKNEDVDLYSEITFLGAKENIRPAAAAIIGLLHLRVGNQIGNFLVHIQLLSRDRTDRVLELRAIEWPFAI